MPNRFKVPIRCGVDTGQLKALIDRLVSLDKKAGRAAVKKGLGEVTQKVMWDAKANVPKRSGMLRKSIGRKVITRKDGAKLLGIVKPRGGSVWVTRPPDYVVQREQRVTKDGKTQYRVARSQLTFRGRRVNPRKYAHLVEFGRVGFTSAKLLSTGKGGTVYGRRVKAVAPRPFMRPAWDKNQGQTVPILHQHLSKALVAAWLKSRAKVPKAKRLP